jgi:hypothetical protein
MRGASRSWAIDVDHASIERTRLRGLPDVSVDDAAEVGEEAIEPVGGPMTTELPRTTGLRPVARRISQVTRGAGARSTGVVGMAV